MKGIKANSNEIRHKGNTLDKVLDKIKPNGSVIASATQLGNVKIGDNISVTEDGTISVNALKTTNRAADNVPLNAASIMRISKPSSFDYNRIYVPGATTNNPGVVKVGRGLSVNNLSELSIDPAYFVTNVQFSASVPSSQYDKSIGGYFGDNAKEIVRCMGLNPSDFDDLEQFAQELINEEIGGTYIVTFYLYNIDDGDSYQMVHGLFHYNIGVVSGSIYSYEFYIGEMQIMAM